MSDTAVSMRKRISRIIQHAFNTEATPDRLFSLGLFCYLAKLLPEANSLFSRVHELCPEDMLYSSFYGLTLAVVEKDADRGLKLFKAALKDDFVKPEIYWSLGQMYLLTGQRNKAYRTFKNGLFVHKDCAYLKTELRKLGVRKKKVFPFLSRNHSLNILAGKLRAMAVSGGASNDNECQSDKASSLPLYDMLQSNEKKLWARLNSHNEVSIDRLWLLHV
jgi:tetratricopeptide (TPR) repeat protein